MQRAGSISHRSSQPPLLYAALMFSNVSLGHVAVDVFLQVLKFCRTAIRTWVVMECVTNAVICVILMTICFGMLLKTDGVMSMEHNARTNYICV